MEIKIIESSLTFVEQNDYREFYYVLVDGQKKLGFLDGEPEDANLSRDFGDVRQIKSLLNEVISAVMAGEEVRITEHEVDSWEELDNLLYPE